VLRLDPQHDLYADPAQRDALVQRQHEDAEIRRAEVVWKRKDRTPITVRLSGRPRRGDGDEVLGFEMWAEDVTGERLLEAQLRQAQKMEAIGRLTGGIAHDFNNELSVILLNAQLAANTLEEGRALQASDLHDIEDAAQRAASMTRKLLGFSRQADLVMAPTDLARVVGNLSKMLRRLLPEIIDLRIDADGPVPAVLADAGTIEQLLLNLVTNARDAMPDGGALQLAVETSEHDETYAAEHAGFRAGTFVTISVSDSGTGMDAATKARIFEPFFTTKAPGVGTGLGLPMVYGIVKQHDGYVNVYSEPGLGTTFRLYFPAIADDAVRQRPRPSETHIRGGTETILLVEDELPLRRAGKRVLEAFGYTVLLASDGAEGLKTYLDHKDTVALVISDLVMPHMTGRHLYDALRQAGSSVRFILASGYTGFEAKERDSLDPAVPFIAKPWRLNEIGPLIRQVLDGDVAGEAPVQEPT
jgi:two-component system cell cycle sensor histidine kinase/response regulator CckA